MNLAESGPVALRNAGDWKDTPPFGTRLLKKRSPAVSDRPGCKVGDGAVPPPNRVNTTQRIAELRQQMTLFNVSAYIVTSDNAHQVYL